MWIRIKSFKGKETEAIYQGKRSHKLPGDIQTAARRKMRMLNAATAPEDLRPPPGNHFEEWKGGPVISAYGSISNDALPFYGVTARKMLKLKIITEME